MCSRFSVVVCVTLLAMVTSARAQSSDAGMHMHHAAAASSPADARQAVQFPPQMQVNFLGNMRDHLQTINDIVQAMSQGNMAMASKIAKERLGLDSPSAAGCRSKGKEASASESASTTVASHTMQGAMTPAQMDDMMARHMPEAMRSMGLSMHTAASEFATVAGAPGVDAAVALKALGQVTQNCVACHAAYRLR